MFRGTIPSTRPERSLSGEACTAGPSDQTETPRGPGWSGQVHSTNTAGPERGCGSKPNGLRGFVSRRGGAWGARGQEMLQGHRHVLLATGITPTIPRHATTLPKHTATLRQPHFGGQNAMIGEPEHIQPAQYCLHQTYRSAPSCKRVCRCRPRLSVAPMAGHRLS